MTTIIVQDTGNTTDVVCIWVPEGSERVYYAIASAVGTLQDFLLNDTDAYDFTWQQDPDGTLHKQTVQSFAEYAAGVLGETPRMFVGDFEVLEGWPAAPDIGSRWQPIHVYEPNSSGDALAVIWRAVEPEVNPDLPWSRRRIVELYGVLAESLVIPGTRVPFPLAPVGADDTLHYMPDATLGTSPDWATAWTELFGESSDAPSLPMSIVGQYSHVIVFTGNPVVFQQDVTSDDQGNWVSVIEPPPGVTLEVSGADLFNTHPESLALEYRFGKIGDGVPVPQGATVTLPIPAGETISISMEHPLQVRAQGVVTTFAVKVQVFVNNLTGVVEV